MDNPLKTYLDDEESPKVMRQMSENFCAGDADVTFVSSDNVLFCIHRKNLEANAGAFPPAEFDTRGEIVHLTENSATLEILFQFIYPRRHPSLVATPFETLAPLTEAAEKYEVFSAMNICNIRMENVLPEHAVEVFNYASRHNYKDILSLAAPLLLDIPLKEITKTLFPHLIVPWILYRDCWSRAARTAITSDATEHYSYNEGFFICNQHSRGRHSNSCYLSSGVFPDRLWVSLGGKRSRNALLGLYKTTLSTCTEGHYSDYSVRRTRLENALETVPNFDTFL